MLDVGRMRKRITLLKQTDGVGDSFGETEQTWVPWKSVWATVKHKKSNERDNNRHIEDQTDYEITVNYEPYGYLIDADMKVRCKIRGKMRIFEIIGDPVEVEDNEYLTLSAREYRVTGEDDLLIVEEGEQDEQDTSSSGGGA